MNINTEFFHNLSKKKYLSYIQALPDTRKEQVRTYATVILTIFAFSFFGIFAIGPTLSTIANLQKQLEDNTFINEQLDTKLVSLSSLQQNFNTLSPQLPILLAAIPETPRVPHLVGQIQSLAVESGVTVMQIKSSDVQIASATPAKNETSSFQIAIDVTGSYAQLLSFYSSLVNFDRIVSFDTITINRTRDGTDILRLSIKANAYFRP